MNYAAILAGGIGSRIKSVNIPKQFVEINGEPIISYTIQSILKPKIFDEIYIAVHKEWINFVNNLIALNFSDSAERIIVVSGGKERIDSINNIISAISSKHQVCSDDVVLIHDAARPFVTEKILCDSIIAAKEYGAVVAALSVSDTMLVSESGEVVESIPDRKKIFHGQAPDTFRLKLFINMLNNLTCEQRRSITGTSQVCALNHHRLYMIKGDSLNFKITNDFDLLIAKQVAESLKENEYNE